MVQDCKRRPYGMSVGEWCQENSITTANYYYRMSQVRKACMDSLPSETIEQPIVPVPTELMNSETSALEESVPGKESYIEIFSHGITLKITEDTASSLIAKVLGVLAMLNDATCFKQIYIVCGYTDLRYGIDSLAAIIKSKLGCGPCVPDTLYLFCGRKTDRIKGLVWERDGFLLLNKRLEKGNFMWPRTESEVRALTGQ